MKKKQRRLERRLEKQKEKKEVVIKERKHRWWEYAGLWALSIGLLFIAEDCLRFLFLKCADIILYFSPVADKYKPFVSLE